MTRYKNRIIFEIANLIKPKCEDKAATTSCTSWMGHHCPKPNSVWLTAAILKWKWLWRHNSNSEEIWCANAESHADDSENVEMKIESRISIWGRLFSEAGNSNISAVDWGIWSKFGVLIVLDVLKCETWCIMRRVGRCLCRASILYGELCWDCCDVGRSVL